MKSISIKEVLDTKKYIGDLESQQSAIFNNFVTKYELNEEAKEWFFDWLYNGDENSHARYIESIEQNCKISFTE